MKLTRDILDALAAAEKEGRVTWGGGPGSMPAAPEVSEKDFQAAVVKLAKRQGYLVYHTHDSRKSEAGFPDLTIVGKGKALFVEVKTETGRTTAAQESWLEAMREAGLDARVWRPADRAEIVKTLR